VKTLSEERQRYAAQLLEQIAGAGDEERRLVHEGTADLDAGRTMSNADMEGLWRRNRP
jgi:hypothetical protein